MVIVTHIRVVGGETHAHISEVRWWNPATGDMNSSTRQTMVDWIRNKEGSARVTDGYTFVDVRVIDVDPPYIQTWADGVATDNLLALPRF